MKLDSNNHSVFLLTYHLVLVVKYRRRVFDDEMSDYARAMFERIGQSHHVTLVEWNHDHDHVHVMFRAWPNTDLSAFVNAYKSASSRLIKREFPRVRDLLWRDAFWTRSYCLLTVGGATIDTVRAYIEAQGEK